VVEPGTVETEFADRSQGGDPLEAADVARAILWAVEQPARVDVNEILVRPTAQAS
jgi:NADP-dependent 3-hydroxy acid dehydrogenase YdfG